MNLLFNLRLCLANAVIDAKLEGIRLVANSAVHLLSSLLTMIAHRMSAVLILRLGTVTLHLGGGDIGPVCEQHLVAFSSVVTDILPIAARRILVFARNAGKVLVAVTKHSINAGHEKKVDRHIRVFTDRLLLREIGIPKLADPVLATQIASLSASREAGKDQNGEQRTHHCRSMDRPLLNNDETKSAGKNREVEGGTKNLGAKRRLTDHFLQARRRYHIKGL